ncbi:MAG TPA: rod shape-determining protein MreC, partial [Gemmatimonadaceae bacterium]|nr:rod shape-determining protein MreC [Gemmatimonadaceae bacterium]
VLASGLLTIMPPATREQVAGLLRRTIVQPILALQRTAERGRNAIVERDAITRRLDSLTLASARLTQLELENDRLRRLVGLGQALRTGFVAAEVVHTQSLGDEHTVTLTAGANEGVTPRSIVVAPDGVVGMVTTVDPASSLAILWTHPDFRVSAQSVGSNVLGIVRPHIGAEGDRYLLELTGVAFRDSLNPGTRIVSSGLGGRYPAGIPVGTVIGEVKTSEGWARTYVVRPAVKPQDVTSVMVVQPERLTNGVASIWPAPVEPATDSSRDSAMVSDAARRAAAVARADSLVNARLRRSDTPPTTIIPPRRPPQ